MRRWRHSSVFQDLNGHRRLTTREFASADAEVLDEPAKTGEPVKSGRWDDLKSCVHHVYMRHNIKVGSHWVGLANYGWMHFGACVARDASVCCSLENEKSRKMAKNNTRD
jgi:hypothetical protein